MNFFMENFELILTLAVIVCFAFYLLDGRGYRRERERLERVFRRGEESREDRLIYAARLEQVQRFQKPEKLPPAFHAAQQKLLKGEALNKEERLWLRKPVYGPEKVIEFFGGSFWILFIIWLIRSFLFEPFRIPSGSMEPNLYAGDFILTSKYSYGLRLPVLGTVIVPVGTPQRGDVVVFRYPLNKKLNYIKRIVGLPGDQIEIVDGHLRINGEEQPVADLTPSTRKDSRLETLIGTEQLGASQHRLQFYPHHSLTGRQSFTVPEGKYFAMGDNRDGSEDSRSWGYVPAENLLGKALVIWMNGNCVLAKGDCDRIGRVIR